MCRRRYVRAINDDFRAKEVAKLAQASTIVKVDMGSALAKVTLGGIPPTLWPEAAVTSELAAEINR